jgi:methylated-DNA-[protein]-cysteine S-methyltransferase
MHPCDQNRPGIVLDHRLDGPRKRAASAQARRRRRLRAETNVESSGFWNVMDADRRSGVTFETELGRCAIRWTGAGVSGVSLPGTPSPLPAYEMASGVPAFVRNAIEGIVAVMAGEPRDLGDVPLDERAIDQFARTVYAATRTIPPGTTRTYGAIAREIGVPDGAREVGAALSRNPFPVIVPCHRVVAANGALTGFSAPGGLATKRRMLQLEGVPGYGQLALFG